MGVARINGPRSLCQLWWKVWRNTWAVYHYLGVVPRPVGWWKVAGFKILVDPDVSFL